MGSSTSASASPSSSPSSSASMSPSGSPSMSPSPSPSASPSAIPAGDVTYTVHDKIRIGKRRMSWVKMEFGGTANDLYPSGGVPITNTGLGMSQTPDSIQIIESNGDVYLYEWDRSANTIRIFSQARVELNAENSAIGTTALELLVIGW